MSGTVVSVLRCISCDRLVGGVGESGDCPGCRADRLLSEGQRAIVAAMRRIVRASHRSNMTIDDIAEECGHASLSSTYHHLRLLRRFGFVDWIDGAAATIHLTRGLGHG